MQGRTNFKILVFFFILVFLFGKTFAEEQFVDSAPREEFPLEMVDHGHLGKIKFWSAANYLILTLGTDSKILIRDRVDGKLLLCHDLPDNCRVLGVTLSSSPYKTAMVYQKDFSSEIRLKVFYTRTGKEILDQKIFDFPACNSYQLHAILNYTEDTIFGTVTSNGYTFGMSFGFRDDGSPAALPTQFCGSKVKNGVCEESLLVQFPFKYLTLEETPFSPKQEVRWKEKIASEKISPDQKCIARLDSDGYLDVWSTETGKSLFVISTDLKHDRTASEYANTWQSFGFSPSGKYLALETGSRMDVFDLQKRTLSASIRLSTIFPRFEPTMGDFEETPGRNSEMIKNYRWIDETRIALLTREYYTPDVNLEKTKYRLRIYSIPNKKLLVENLYENTPEQEFSCIDFSPSSRYFFFIKHHLNSKNETVVRTEVYDLSGTFDSEKLPAPVMVTTGQQAESFFDFISESPEKQGFLTKENNESEKISSTSTTNHPGKKIPKEIRENWHDELPEPGKITFEYLYPYQAVWRKEGKILSRVYHFSQSDYLCITPEGEPTGSPTGLQRLK